jgi:hypothetical protein
MHRRKQQPARSFPQGLATTRASDQVRLEFSQFDNSAVMQEILALRQEESRLAGLPVAPRRGLSRPRWPSRPKKS